MQALVLSEGRLEYRTDIPQPVRKPGEALIRVRLAGICSTDLEIVKGYSGFQGILGHEFVGQVEESPDPKWLGKRVVGSINLGCRQCAVCQSDGPEHCPRRRVLGIIDKDGAFADYISLPVDNLLAIPEALADETTVFTEPLAAALRIREQVRIRPTDRVAVVGPGRLGLLIGQVVALGGTQVTMIGRRSESLALPARLDLKTGLNEEFPDDSFDLVVEATGNEAGFANSLRLVRPKGTLVLKSTFSGEATLNLTKLVVAEIAVVGSRCGPFGPALRILDQNAVDVASLVEATYPLREGLKAFEHAARPGIKKILLRP